MDSLIRTLTARQRSVQDVRIRLEEKGYEQHAVSRAVERALASGLLDDDAFARRFIADRLSAGWGERRIEQELHRLGIAVESIEGYPDDFFSEDDRLERARLALSRHRTRSKNPRQAAYRFLLSRGYDPDTASAAVRASFEEACASPEEYG